MISNTLVVIEATETNEVNTKTSTTTNGGTNTASSKAPSTESNSNNTNNDNYKTTYIRYVNGSKTGILIPFICLFCSHIIVVQDAPFDNEFRCNFYQGGTQETASTSGTTFGGEAAVEEDELAHTYELYQLVETHV